ncbi:MAG TPA: hypothetical protein VFY73_28285 [Ideonella sp.]|uniref:hypothetical protein n=1 Tax=Ideonella sp. TaxID=1929293 RepID=UPI002E35F342|nr:hypothetical protein [Ideonella sp.]HEX5687934.1 hypothetical protein [Ideonella sp.]
MAELDDKRWQQIRQIRERRQRLAVARATQAAADWRTRQGEAQRQDAEVRQQADARLRHSAAQRQTRGATLSAADWRDGHAWSGELQRRIDDGRRLALLAHAEAMQAQMFARGAQAGARRAAQDHDRAQQMIERAQARAAAAAQQAEEQQLEDLAPLRWWRSGR